MQYNFTKIADLDQLIDEIRSSSIVTALDLISSVGDSLYIYFKAELSTDDEITLGQIIAGHVPVPKVQETVVRVDAQPPFAEPTFRTKWDATSEVITAQASETKTIDYVLEEERYCHGGEVVSINIKMGDWIEACIIDDENDPKIPVPYRESLCENWPVIATYIKKSFLRPGEGTKVLSTYPLNAKITPGLILRVKLHTTNEAGERKFATNYFLTKKL